MTVWVLYDEGQKFVYDMPDNYIVEMILDWWTFSWKTNKLTEIFSWYEKNKSKIKLSENTRQIVEEILNKMKELL